MAAWTRSVPLVRALFMTLVAAYVGSAERAFENSTDVHDDASSGHITLHARGSGGSVLQSKKAASQNADHNADKHSGSGSVDAGSKTHSQGHVTVHVRAGGRVLQNIKGAANKAQSKTATSKTHSQAASQQSRSSGNEESFKFICCLHKIEADADGNPDVTELQIDQQDAMKKCVLTAIPLGCQHSHGMCVNECKDLLKTSLQWHQLRQTAQTQVLEQVQIQGQTANQQAEETRRKMLKDAETEKEAAERGAEEAYERTLDSVTAAFEEARKADQEASANVERLKLELEEAQKVAEAKKQQLEAQQRMLTESQESAEQTRQRAMDDSVQSLEDSKRSADEFHRHTNEQVQQLISAAQEELDTIGARVAEVKAQAEERDAEEKRRPCLKDGKPQDCCCSIHEDASAQEDARHIAMRIKGDTFINWEMCIAGKPYADTSASSVLKAFSWCDWFGHCDRCEDLICLNAHGQKGSCP